MGGAWLLGSPGQKLSTRPCPAGERGQDDGSCLPMRPRKIREPVAEALPGVREGGTLGGTRRLSSSPSPDRALRISSPECPSIAFIRSSYNKPVSISVSLSRSSILPSPRRERGSPSYSLSVRSAGGSLGAGVCTEALVPRVCC